MPDQWPSSWRDDDYYAIIGVPVTASREEITQAYHRLARSTHPDADPGNPGATDRFRALADAYQVLSDPSARAAYDESRRAAAVRLELDEHPIPPAAGIPRAVRLGDRRPRPTGATVEPGPVIWTRGPRTSQPEDRP